MTDSSFVIEQAAQIVADADAIYIGTGAGMGVDSGLPDFRGNEGFWKAYPPMEKLGLSFYDLANPVWFGDDPQRAWGFYGHRRNLYRSTMPHCGFEILQRWINSKMGSGFVFTSNVDGHFQKTGFEPDMVVECHGAIDFNQCSQPCCQGIWKAPQDEIDVDLETFRAREPLPKCKSCGRTARPNILMFGDYGWIEYRTAAQYENMNRWMQERSGCQLAVIEIGAGTAVPTVRHQCQRVAKSFGSNLIRINPREPGGDAVVSIAMGGLSALEQMDAMFNGY